MFWDPVFEHISSLVGAPPDQLKVCGPHRYKPQKSEISYFLTAQLLTALLVSYPLGSLFTRLPLSRPNLAHTFSIVISAFFLGPLLGLWTGILHLVFACFVTYLVVAAYRGTRMPWIVFG